MSSSHPVFMRCLKPNQQKKAQTFDEIFVRAQVKLESKRIFIVKTFRIQLRYCGMLETTRIRKEGFSVRLTFEEFIQK